MAFASHMGRHRFFKVPFPLIVLCAGLIGLVDGKLWQKKFLVVGGHSKEDAILGDEIRDASEKPSFLRAAKVCIVCGLLWWVPVFLLSNWLGRDHAVIREGIFFSKASMVTFGGAYAVLPYVSQQAVENHHWLGAGKMLDGLGLAETTPGPLIMVLQFVGFLGGWNRPGNLSPLVSGTLGAFVTTWTTFVPCFLWIFLGAPHIEQLRGNVKLTSALSAVTAAVVGVILNLSVWFGQHVLFPKTTQVDWFALALALVAFIGLLKWKWNIVVVVFASGVLGLIYKTAL